MVIKPLQMRYLAVLFTLCFINSIKAESLTIAVASNFNLAMQHLVDAYKQTNDTELRVSYGSSGKLYAQIVNGAPFDIFLSADQHKPQTLIDQQLTEPNSRLTYAYGALALWSASADAIDANANILFSGQYNKLALANPKLAPYGLATLDTLESLGLLDASRSHWVQGENISQTYQFVATKNADIGFVALSQIKYQGKLSNGSAWIVPSALHRPIKQDGVVLARSNNKKGASHFMRFLQSPEALSILRDFGYQQGPAS